MSQQSLATVSSASLRTVQDASCASADAPLASPAESSSQRMRILDADGEAFWSTHFQGASAASIDLFVNRMLAEFKSRHLFNIIEITSRFIIPGSVNKREEVTVSEFDRFLRRFGPFETSIRAARSVFFKMMTGGRWVVKDWYFGTLCKAECQKVLLEKENQGKFIVVEDMKSRWNKLAVAYTKVVSSGGENGSSRTFFKIKELTIRPRKGKDTLFCWLGAGSKTLGAKNIETALDKMTSGREAAQAGVGSAPKRDYDKSREYHPIQCS